MIRLNQQKSDTMKNKIYENVLMLSHCEGGGWICINNRNNHGIINEGRIWIQFLIENCFHSTMVGKKRYSANGYWKVDFHYSRSS